MGKGLGLVHDGAAKVTLEGLHELVVQVGQLLLEQLPHHGRQLALQLLLLRLPHACLKIASLLLVPCTQAQVKLKLMSDIVDAISVKGMQRLPAARTASQLA